MKQLSLRFWHMPKHVSIKLVSKHLCVQKILNCTVDGGGGAFPSVAKLTTAEGPGVSPYGVVANVLTWFNIYPVDAYGNPQTNPSLITGDDFSLNVVSGPGGIDANIYDNGDGTYYVEYTASEPGQYLIDVLLHTGLLPISGSPFLVNIGSMF